MKLYSLVCCTLLFVNAGVAEAAPAWPSSIDELEDVMFLNSGYRSRGFSSHVTPCSYSEFGPGRQTAAEWLRIGFHDMATTNVYNPPHGGIDASLMFELNDGENIGAGFSSTLTTYGGLYNSQLPVADLIALGVYASVRACGGPVIAMRGGRKDALKAGPIGVPQPQNGRGIFSNQFTRMGFNTTAMIQMTACGHTLGGVHAANFPQIVAAGTAPNDFQLFDNSYTFDNAIATRYINGPNTDPMSVGIAVSSSRDADNAVFGADGNVTLRAMTNAATFNAMCSSILQEMIETVDPALVTLSDIITPYEVKPYGLALELSSSGTQLTFSGDVRVRTTTRSATQIASVLINYSDRNGASGGSISTTISGTASGFDDSFAFYGFSAGISATTSISSFTVAITLTAAAGGSTTTYSNNGVGFPVQDSVLVQTSQSCLNNGNLTVVAAVRSSISGPVNLGVTQKVARTGSNPVPALSNSNATMTSGAAVGPYLMYTGSIAVTSTSGTKFGVSSGNFADSFKDASALGSSCAAVGVTPTATSTSVSSTSVPSTTVSSTSVLPSPTLTHKQTVGPYNFQGCYTEGNGERALSQGAFYNYTGMTVEQCAADCAGTTYFGIEYGGECYCGGSLAASSTIAALSDCSFVCPGDFAEYCGAGNRLELYRLGASTVTTSSAMPTASSPSPTTIGTTLKTSSVKPSSVTASSTTSTSTSSAKSPSLSTSLPSSNTITSTSSSATAVQTLGIKQTVGAYSYIGCYTEGNGVRALSAASFYDYSAMTLEECATDCTAYQFFGVEYGGECYCGNTIDPSSVLAATSDCSFVCPGSQYELCGAGNRLEMYKKGAVASSSSTLISSTVSTSSSLSQSTTTRNGLTTSTTTASSTKSSTVKAATSSSKSTSLTSIFKVSTSQSSSTLSTSTIKSSSSSTSSVSVSPSTTSSSSSTATASSLTSSAPSSSQTALSIKPVVGKYKYFGCQTEATNMRALSSTSYYDYNAMTLEECAANCAGFTYFGVEYGGECYCGNSFNAGSVPAPNSDCSFVCPGQNTEYCGAGNRLTAYALS